MVSVNNANAYHDLRITKDPWESLTAAEKSRALVSAQDALAAYEDRYPTVAAYEKAIYEQALWMSQGGVAENQEQGVSSFGLSGISQSYDLKGRPGHIAPKAWRFINGNTARRGRIL